MKKNTTIKELAKELNLSIATVSRAFNANYSIKPDTKMRILEVAKRMGYRPNPLAQSLTQKKNGLLGVIVPDFTNSYFSTIVSSIQMECRKMGYQLLILSSGHSVEQEEQNIRILEKSRVEGIMIALTLYTEDVSYLERLKEKIPVVQFVGVSEKLDTLSVAMDDYQCARKVTEHLIEEGYKKILYVSPPDNLLITHRRKKGFFDSMIDHPSLSLRLEVVEGEPSTQTGAQLANKIVGMPNKPEAILCFNDLIAVGLMEQFKVLGVNIPGDIALAGFTESKIAIYTSPCLTSVQQPAEEIGQITTQLMMDQIKGITRRVNKETLLEGVINARASSVRYMAFFLGLFLSISCFLILE
ncbi:MAG: LacI family DNA-binding transcriptional regulator [Phocaeicola sp.]